LLAHLRVLPRQLGKLAARPIFVPDEIGIHSILKIEAALKSGLGVISRLAR